jgi:hypothetical protein
VQSGHGNHSEVANAFSVCIDLRYYTVSSARDAILERDRMRMWVRDGDSIAQSIYGIPVAAAKLRASEYEFSD